MAFEVCSFMVFFFVGEAYSTLRLSLKRSRGWGWSFELGGTGTWFSFVEEDAERVESALVGGSLSDLDFVVEAPPRKEGDVGAKQQKK
ncbi:hypothetical protein GGU11DRAFT_800249 [Lentinula aff. detonsa]|nr:hypothetical protein GGU11DRAFT_800249 [Lentinula aff. detonsa]